tara:strand:+ start:669 stop:3095 length:2427 start_codon:yes stop_codon:yes gene_type:complete
MCQAATNIDFTSQDAKTRGGFVCLPALGNTPFGQEWVSTTPASASSWLAVEFANNLFVAVGTGGKIMTSSDGTTWTSRTPSTTPNFKDVAYGNGVWVAVGSTTGGGPNPLLTSSDGITWTVPATAPAAALAGVVYGNGLWVAIGSGRSAISSDNGATWTNTTGISALSSFTAKIAYANGLFVGIGSLLGDFATSSDGITWVANTPSPATTLTDVVYGNGLFVALGGSGIILTSPDGMTWTQYAGASSASNTWLGLNYGNGTFIAVANTGSDSRAMSSTEGTTWLEMSNVPSSAWQSVTYGNNAWVAVGTNVSMVLEYNGTFVFASGRYSDPTDTGTPWIVLAGATSAGFYAFGQTARSISYPSGYTLSEQATIVQANNYLFIFGGSSQYPIYWNGKWGQTFIAVPASTLGAGYENIPYSNSATYYQNRLWVIDGKDTISASQLLDFENFNVLTSVFNINVGTSDYVVCSYPFGNNSLVVFENRSIYLLQNVNSTALSSVTSTEITRQLGIIGINAVTAVGPDIVYFSSDRNITTIRLNIQNATQAITIPISRDINPIVSRVNWTYGYKISLGYWNNLLFVALPLDNATVCNTILVYNFITNKWFGEWTFASSINMAVQSFVTANYLGRIRMHVVTEDGRIFVTNEGPQDISGTTVAEISTSLTTRAFVGDNNSKIGRRMFVDLSTNRPNFSIEAFAEPAADSTEIITDQTYLRSQSWKFNDSTYDMTNANDDYNRAWRKDYAGYPTDSIKPESGFLPEMTQNYRMPVIQRLKGRLCWLKVTNTQGTCTINSIGQESRSGDRSSLVQVG